MNKSQIKDLIRKGRLSKAMEALLEKASQQDKDLHSEAIMLSARLNALKRDANLGIISSENANINNNQITRSLLYLVDQMED